MHKNNGSQNQVYFFIYPIDDDVDFDFWLVLFTS